MPLAIAELRNGSYRFLKATPGFVKLIRTLGVKSVKECEELFNDTNSNINKQINRLLENSTQTGEVSEIDFVMNGNYANIGVRYIDQEANSTAFLLEVANLSQNRNLARSKKREEAMRFIYSLFDRVELINLSEGTVENLYRNNMHTSSILRGGAIKEVIDNYAKKTFTLTILPSSENFMMKIPWKNGLRQRGARSISPSICGLRMKMVTTIGNFTV